METIKTMGIVVSTIDHKDRDKLVNIFTLDYGIIFASLKGVKALNAKNKFAKEIFCFGEFVISKPYNTIISVNVEDSFFEITKDIDKYYCGCAVLQAIKAVLPENEKNPQLFVETLKAIGAICYDSSNCKYVLVKFLIMLLSACGYKLALSNCSNCKDILRDRVFIDIEFGAMVCSACRNSNCVEISNKCYSCLKLLSNTDYDKLATLKLASGSEDEAFDILNLNFEKRFGKKLIML